ncbi:MAG: acetyl-coenzyme A synthetase N-terminal domain-containing protein, partial [Pseudomonadota bacterium]
MMDTKIYPVEREVADRAHIDNAGYMDMYNKSVADPDAFWAEHGKRIDWIKPYVKVQNWSYGYPDVSIKWYEDGTLNVSANCIDRH